MYSKLNVRKNIQVGVTFNVFMAKEIGKGIDKVKEKIIGILFIK